MSLLLDFRRELSFLFFLELCRFEVYVLKLATPLQDKADVVVVVVIGCDKRRCVVVRTGPISLLERLRFLLEEFLRLVFGHLNLTTTASLAPEIVLALKTFSLNRPQRYTTLHVGPRLRDRPAEHFRYVDVIPTGLPNDGEDL